MPLLNLYIIHTETCTVRAARLHGTIQSLRTTAIKAGFEVNPILILKPLGSELPLQEYQSKITYDPTGNPTFDGLRQMLSVEVLANIEKHLECWRRIAATTTAPGAAETLHVIIEDDILLLPDGLANWSTILTNVISRDDWDILFLGMANADGKKDLNLYPVQDIVGPVLPCKDSYILRPSTAAKLLEEWKQYRFSLRNQLSWILANQSSIRARITNLRCILDGSKVGIYPSTLHPNNMLVFNREYMELFSYMSKPLEELKKGFSRVTQIYHSVQNMPSPDFMHLYGVLLFKYGRTKEAEAVLKQAIEIMKGQQGLLTNRSDLLNNLISMYETMQDTIPVASKYSDPTMALSDEISVLS